MQGSCHSQFNPDPYTVSVRQQAMVPPTPSSSSSLSAYPGAGAGGGGGDGGSLSGTLEVRGTYVPAGPEGTSSSAAIDWRADWVID